MLGEHRKTVKYQAPLGIPELTSRGQLHLAGPPPSSPRSFDAAPKTPAKVRLADRTPNRRHLTLIGILSGSVVPFLV